MKHWTTFLINILFAGCVFGISPAQADETSCMEEIVPLEKGKAKVSQLGGTWSLFEGSRKLRDESVNAIQLDSKITQVLFTLKYLCRTLDGVPPNDLAQYISKELKKHSVDEFRKEQKILGKSDGEIKVWLQFHQFSKEHEHRQLSEESVSSTIDKAHTVMDSYIDFAHRVQKAPRTRHAEEAKALASTIDRLFEQDSNMALASHEIEQVPHWDLDEDVGGS